MTGMLRLFSAILIAAAVLLLGHEAVPHEHAHAQTIGGCADHDASAWHAPYEWDGANGCVYGHEHGDAPPQWIAAAGYTVGFDQHHGFHGNTTSAENTLKHAAMKGFLADFRDYAGGSQQLYARVHIATNVLDRMARYHSYEMFLKDSAGHVSHWQGWFNAGDPVADRFVYDGRNDPGRRPIVLVQDEATFPTVKNEHWYTRASATWNWDFAWTADATTFYYSGENADTDPWLWKPTGRQGTVRRFEPAWYGQDSRVAASRTQGIPRDREFWATQFGEIVGGPADPKCAATSTRFGGTYANVCLSNFIYSTARSVESQIPGGNARERVFPGIGLGIGLPN